MIIDIETVGVTSYSNFNSKNELRALLTTLATEDGITPEEYVKALFTVRKKKPYFLGDSTLCYENVQHYMVTLGNSMNDVYYWDNEELYPLSNKDCRNVTVYVKDGWKKDI